MTLTKNKLIVMVLLAQIPISNASAVTLSDAIAQSKQITAPSGLKNPNHYAISTSTVKEAQSSNSKPTTPKNIIKKSGFCESGAYTIYNICALADTTYSCFLSGLTKATDDMLGEIFIESGVWKLKVVKEGGRNWSVKQGLLWTCTKYG